MSNYVVGVVSHVARERERERLRDAVFPDFIEVDDGTYGATGNHLLTMDTCHRQAVHTGCEWVVILEDDALPVSGFHPQLSAALDVAPSTLVSLYNGSGYPAQRQADFMEATLNQDACWIMHKVLRHAVGYALHVECFQMGVLDRVTELARDGWAPDDGITAWARSTGTPVAYTNPSLVDHDDSIASVIGLRKHLGQVTSTGRKRPRKAHWAGTRLRWSDSCIPV